MATWRWSDDQNAAWSWNTVSPARPGEAVIGGYVEIAFPVGDGDCRTTRCDATRVGDAVEPCGQAAGDRNQRATFVHAAPIDRALGGEGVRRGGDEDIATHECDRRTMQS